MVCQPFEHQIHSLSELCPPPHPPPKGGHIVLGTDPVGAGVNVGVGVKLLVRSVTWIPFGIFDDTW